MSVRINIHRGQYEYFTNFDIVQGTVELHLNSSESVSSVVVKIEGISKSLCYTEPGSGKTRSKTPVQELHKVLYLTEPVFPDDQLRKTSTANSFTLPPGKHSWAFKFQIPVNNDCKNELRTKPTIGSILQGPHAHEQRHVQQILPPSMSGSDEVWVRYFVKATVIRPSMLAINRREYVPFIFLPIEAPRAEPSSGSRSFFVRRQYTLSLEEEGRRSSLKSFFTEKARKDGDTIALEVRMPNPPTLVPGLPVNMDIMGFFESNFNDNQLAITKIAVYLCITTKVRAAGLRRAIGNRMTCFTEDFNVPFVFHKDLNQPAAILQLIKTKPLIVATDVAPTFSTCNVARTYELEVAVTVANTRNKSRELIVLNCPVTILSGVQAPPPQENRPALPDRPDHGSSSMTTREPAGKDNDLPTYTEAVEVGAPSSRPRIPVMSSGTALRTRTSYRVGQDYYEYPNHDT
ncbi:Arrestin [Taphrina deformans PYCC 5710]|uniref:Arrestin n=1 Tax=Taphrina deformans (strain PYCC 5710 / ATCC 11124 / CBS 356.35 / IMI 108563 / JCM 9778 / NBRC 8474) TaxID=1097556 RepID=R4XH33_TAPDE|nr:Arrestin [Taphrina deformans PYCC 5710]|eukprot:CCG82691.1 Arrestin [Taphrina deformans PYCC 5710]